MSSAKARWQMAVRTDPAWPSTCRVVRGTLLALAAEMRPDGVVRPLERHVLAFRVGLPVRTLNRHLACAVEMGWLSHRRVRSTCPRSIGPPSLTFQDARCGLLRRSLRMPPVAR